MKRSLVTVKMLTAQMRAQGRIELPPGALITPAAADWLRGTRTPVQPASAAAVTVDAGPRVNVVGDAANPVVSMLLPALERRRNVRFLPCHGHMTGLLAAVTVASEDLAKCAQRRAIALLRDGAIVNCVANHQPGVRAALVTRPAALYELMRRLGLNFLILETERLAVRQMQALMDTFLDGELGQEAVIADALDGRSTAVSPHTAAPHTERVVC